MTTADGRGGVCAAMPDAILEVDGLVLAFAGIKALDGVSLSARSGHITSVIGPNGAGKTSLFNCLSRLYRPQAGRITFEGKPLDRVPRHGIIEFGIARTFQNLALFDTMSVRDNILVGRHRQTRSNLLASALRLPSVRGKEAAARARAEELADLLGLSGILDVCVSDLSLGTRKQVELARALISEPRLLMLDEPAAGLNHTEVGELGDFILRLRDGFGVSVLLVEHHMHLVMSISDRIVVMNFGKTIAAGDPAEVRAHPEVIRAYLGGSA